MKNTSFSILGWYGHEGVNLNMFVRSYKTVATRSHESNFFSEEHFIFFLFHWVAPVLLTHISSIIAMRSHLRNSSRSNITHFLASPFLLVLIYCEIVPISAINTLKDTATPRRSFRWWKRASLALRHSREDYPRKSWLGIPGRGESYQFRSFHLCKPINHGPCLNIDVTNPLACRPSPTRIYGISQEHELWGCPKGFITGQSKDSHPPRMRSWFVTDDHVNVSW